MSAREPLTHDGVRTIVREELQALQATSDLHNLLQVSDTTLQVRDRPTSIDGNPKQGVDRRTALLENLREGLIGILKELSGDRLVSGEFGQGLSEIVVRHETSPSADDVGAHSVGDRPAVGVHTWPPQPPAATTPADQQ